MPAPVKVTEEDPDRQIAGMQCKIEVLRRTAAHLTGPQLQLRIEAIVEKFTDVQADLGPKRKP